MLNIATGYTKNTLSCSELNEEHAGEGFRSLRYILTPLWACKAKKCHFSRKFDLWPDLTRSNIDLGPKTICAIARSRRGASTGLFREALRPSGADRQGGGSYQPPPPDRPRYEKCPDRARVNTILLKLLMVLEIVSKYHFAHLTVFLPIGICVSPEPSFTNNFFAPTSLSPTLLYFVHQKVRAKFDFVKELRYSDETHFHVDDKIDSKKFGYWLHGKPDVVTEAPLHSVKIARVIITE